MRLRRFDDFHREGDILVSRQLRQQAVILKDDADIAAHERDFARLQLADIESVDGDLPFGRNFLAVDQFHKG